jgi:hypothetical protein
VTVLPKSLSHLNYIHLAISLSVKKKKNIILKLLSHKPPVLGQPSKAQSSENEISKSNLHKAHKTSCLVFGKQLDNILDRLQFHSSVKQKYIRICHPAGLTAGGPQ